MSLESKIEALTAAVVNLTTILQSTTVSVHAQQVPAAAPQTAAATVPAAAPAMPAVPALTAPAAAPVMPAPPSFAAPTPAAAVAGAPFSDPQGLINYAMSKYTALGMEKGQMIQNVITSLGYQNINDIQPGHYAAFYQGVEAIV